MKINKSIKFYLCCQGPIQGIDLYTEVLHYETNVLNRLVVTRRHCRDRLLSHCCPALTVCLTPSPLSGRNIWPLTCIIPQAGLQRWWQSFTLASFSAFLFARPPRVRAAPHTRPKDMQLRCTVSSKSPAGESVCGTHTSALRGTGDSYTQMTQNRFYTTPTTGWMDGWMDGHALPIVSYSRCWPCYCYNRPFHSTGTTP